MEKYKLTNEDYKWLERIIQTTISIETLYKKLFNLEITVQKDSEEYKKVMDYLSIAIDVEDKAYEDADLSYYKCIALADYIINDRISEKFLNDTESIMQQDYNNRVLRRILNNLVHRILSDYDSIREMLPNELVELVKQLGMPNPDELVSKAIYSDIELQKAFEKDTFNGFLTFLQEFIDKKEYNFFKEHLIRTKYNTAFINKNIEIDMRSNKFEIPETFYENARFVADLIQIDLDLFYILKNSYGANESTKQISEIIEMSDLDYGDTTKATTSILRQCLMRASFLLMSDEVISDVNYEFHEFVENKKYLDRHKNDHISEQLVINCFRGIKKDRNKPSVLSLGYKKI